MRSAIAESKAELVGISVTMHCGITAVRDLIDLIKTSAETANVVVLVGGRPFLLSDTLWRSVGADGYAPGAAEAVLLGKHLVSGGS